MGGKRTLADYHFDALDGMKLHSRGEANELQQNRAL